MSTAENQKNYIKNSLIKNLIEKYFNDSKLLEYDVIPSTGLDGFMSALYLLNLKMEKSNTKEIKNHHLIIKFMKGDTSFRESSKSYTQFANEIHIYHDVLPYYEKIVSELLHHDVDVNNSPGAISSAGDVSAKNVKKSSINVRDWVPYVYVAEYGCVNGLGDSSSAESMLVMENLKPLGYRNGPKQFLDRNHLLMMTKLIAKYHSISYVLRIKKDSKLNELIDKVIPLPFPSEKDTNAYDILYRVAFDRFYSYKDSIQATEDDDEEFFAELDRLKIKYFSKPTQLLEFIRCDPLNDPDDVFPVLLHGDYNRNNVLFQYDKSDGFDNPRDCKMIDFQELRYGTPAIDLPFYMYINMEASLRNEIWMDLIHYYHENIIDTLKTILNVDAENELLNPYRFEKFYEHFSKYAFYGVMICLHFYPWYAGTEAEVNKISYLFETDMHSKEFYDISMSIGGDKANKLIMDIVKHAWKMGYTKAL